MAIRVTGKTSMRLVAVAASLIIGLFLFEVSLRLGGWALTAHQTYHNRAAMEEEGVVRVLCVGESTTALGGRNAYPQQLERVLNAKAEELTYRVINVGRVGATTGVLLERFPDQLDRYRPHVVVTMMGINDAGDLIFYTDRQTDAFSWWQRLRTTKFLRWLQLTLYGETKDLSRAAWQRLAWAESLRDLPKTDADAHVQAGWAIDSQGQLRSMETLFTRALAIAPQHAGALAGLGLCAKQRSEMERAESYFLQALAADEQHERALCELADLYLYQGKRREAEIRFKEVLRVNASNEWALIELSGIYEEAGRYAEALTLVKKAAQVAPRSAWLHGRMASLYNAQGDQGQAHHHRQRANALRRDVYNPMTMENYHLLRDLTLGRGIGLICMEYPLREMEALQRMLEFDPRITFVSHQDTFRRALTGVDHKLFFVDLFGGEFGHCTRAGNRLIAEHLADVILQKYDKPR